MGKSNNDKMVEILRRIKPEMNGAVTGEMEKRGIRYGLNYGVSVPVIRLAAREFAPDHALAEYLFRQDVRELKLAAVYVDDPRQVTSEQMERWTDAMPADEVIEHAAMNLFYASPDANRVICAWLSANDPKRRKGALHMIGKQAQVHATAPSGEPQAGIEKIESYLEKIGNEINQPGEEWPLWATVYALSRIAGCSLELRAQTEQLIGLIARSSDRSVREIAGETAALLEYVQPPGEE